MRIALLVGVVVATSALAWCVHGSTPAASHPVPPGDTAARRTAPVPAAEATPGTRAARLAHKTEGTAPFAVFFDAANPASGVVQPPALGGHPDYAAFEYAYDFGDSAAGRWPTTGRSRNASIGWVAAHVYERPGTYTVTLRVTDTAGGVHPYRETIVVRPFTGPTYYVSSSSGSDGNVGTSAERPLASFAAARAKVGPGVRILFRRGDTFTTDATMDLDAPGPGFVGAYGEGPAPIVRMSSADPAFRFDAPDWRLADLHLIGPVTDMGTDPADTGVSTGGGVEGDTIHGTRDALVLRVEVERFRLGVAWSQLERGFHHEAFIVGCNVHDVPINGMYVGASHLAVLGTRVTDVGLSHAVRVWQAHRSVLSDDVFHRSGGDRPALKLHGPDQDAVRHGWLPSEESVIVHCDFLGHVSVVTLEPQNAESDERVRGMLFEGNVVRTMGDTDELLQVHARSVTVRNDVFVAPTGTAGLTMVRVSRRGIEPAPEDNRIYNNTAWITAPVADVSFCAVGDDAARTVVRNNLAGGTALEGGRFVQGAGRGLTADHNLAVVDPGFVDANRERFDLAPGSPAIDRGHDVGLFYDRLGRPRVDDPDAPNLGDGPLPFYDLGAYERQLR